MQGLPRKGPPFRLALLTLPAGGRRTRLRAQPLQRRTTLILALLLAGVTFGGVRVGHGAEPEALPPDAPPIRVLVAVLPFQIHSARPLGELDQQLAELLSARLEAGGRVQVVDAVVVRETLVEHITGERSEDLVRELARRVGAEWVVEGSLTELAGRYSLDVRVTPAEDERPSHSMVFTATGDDELFERVNELSDRVLQIVAGEAARSRVVDVRIVGGEALDEVELYDAIQTAPGAIFDNDAVRADLEALRSASGVGAATVQTERVEDGMVVTYRVVPVERFGGTTAAESGDRVLEIRIEGNRRIEADAIRARITTEAGDEFSAARLAEDVRAVNELGFFKNIQVLSDKTDDGRILTFVVEENPLVRQITIAGNDEVDSERIREQLTLTTGATLDVPLLLENRDRIEALYHAEGFYLADVSYEIEELPNEAVGIHFEVDENKQLKLRKIVFTGNEHFTEKQLTAELQTKTWKFHSFATRFIEKGVGTYAEPLFLQDLQTIERMYADAGYIRVEVGDPEVDATEKGLVVTVPIIEGPRFKVGAIEVAGDPTLRLDEIKETLALSDDEWFNRSHLTEDVDRIEFRYTDLGFYQAEVEPVTDIHASTLTVDVLFEISKGPLFFVRQIDLFGNTRTVDRVIRREMSLVEGELYSARSISISQRRLDRLGYFDEVNFEPRPSDQPDQVDLSVRVAEKPTGQLSFGAGFSSQDSFVLNGNISQNNLFGRGYAVSLNGDFGGRSKQWYGTFANRRFLDSEYGLAATLFQSETDFEGFKEKSLGADVTVSRTLDATGNTRGFMRYGLASREIDVDSSFIGTSVSLRQFEQDATTTSRISLTIARDTRNDAILATSGHELSGTGTFAGLGGFTRFIRLEGRGAYYTKVPRWLPLPARDRSSMQFSGGIGWTQPFNSLADFKLRGPDVCQNSEVCPLSQIDTALKLPLTDRYFMGGAGALQLRGYKARSVGPRRSELYETNPNGSNPNRPSGLFTPVNRDSFGQCTLSDGKCNSLEDQDISDFQDLNNTEVVGGSQFLAFSAEYRFPVSEALGLIGILFIDGGNAFAEDETMFDPSNWRFGTGVGALWFSPFGPLQVFLGFPIDPLEDEDSPVFEFNVGGSRG